MSVVIWLTGYSGAGKTTLSKAVQELLGERCYILEGVKVRNLYCKGLGFSKADQVEHGKRIAEKALEVAKTDIVVLAASVSPYGEMRAAAREVLGERYIEVFCDRPLKECERRDVHGLYRAGRSNFRKINYAYEKPENPDLRLDTYRLSVDACVKRILRELKKRGVEI
jgi:adenylyl-sulfate kinase